MRGQRGSTTAMLCIGATLLPVMTASSGATAGAGFSLVVGRRAQAVIVLPHQPSWLERHAAEELQRYVREVSGATLPIALGGKGEATKHARALLLLGRRAASEMGVALPRLDGDAFVVRTIRAYGKPCLLLAGGTERATLYAVYHFLEAVLHIGFFWDGEQVPKRASVAVPKISTIERPHFPVRQNFQNCAFGYTTPPWDLADWKRELDWTARRRFNRVMLPYPWGAVEKLAWKRMGYPASELTERERRDIALCKELVGYARQLGMEVILPGYYGQVPNGFQQKNAQARYIENSLYPTDPLFKQVGLCLLGEYTELFGTDHIYNVDPYPERPPAVTLDFATGVMNCLRAADPKAVWYASGWAWRYRNYWSKETLRLFLERLPEDAFYVCDIWSEYDPIYRDYDYFWGKPWGFSVIHSYGGSGHLYGDVSGLVRRMRELIADPKAKQCRVFYLNPELLHYNTFYFDLAARLGWNPKAANLDAHIADYALRRYGQASAAKMAKVLRILVESVYGPTGGCDPFFHRRMSDYAPNIEEMLALRKTAQRLAHAVALALDEELREKDNPLYVRDVVDVTRQALAEVFNLYTFALYAAYQRGDRAAFGSHATALTEMLDTLEALLSAYPPYHIAPVARKVMAQPGGTREVWEGIKNTLYTFAAGGPLDYQAKDFHELLKFYQRPRFEAWLKALREGFDAKPPQLEETYKAIEQAWVQLDVAALPRPLAEQTVLEYAREGMRLIERLTTPSAATLLTGRKELADTEVLAQFHHSFIANRPSPAPRPSSLDVLDDFDGRSLDAVRWRRWQGDPNIGQFDVSPNICRESAAVIRTGVATDMALRGDAFVVEFLGCFVNPHPDSSSFSVFAPETGETITLYHQAGGPYGVTVRTTPDGKRETTFDGIGGGQEWHVYGVEKTPESVAFLLDGRKVAERQVAFRSREWCLGVAVRSWLPYRGHTALVLDWVAKK